MKKMCSQVDKRGKEGLPGEGVYKELAQEIMSLTEEEVEIVIHLLTASQT